MKKIYAIISIVLLSYAGSSFAAKNPAEGTIHLSKLGLAYPGPITVEYVSCENGPACLHPSKSSLVIAQDGNQKFPLLGVDTFLVSLKSQDGRVIWGPQMAEYGKNACSTTRDANSFTFNLNGDNSVTCITGTD